MAHLREIDFYLRQLRLKMGESIEKFGSARRRYALGEVHVLVS